MPNRAIELFNQIKHPSDVNLIVLFNACAQLRTLEALNLTRKVSKEMPNTFYSNLRLLTSLLDALMKCGDVTTAESLFDKSNEKALSMYRVMITGYNKTNNPSKTLSLFNQMKLNGFKADTTIYLSAIKALSQVGDYETSQSIVKQIPDSFLVDNQIQNALIDMWVS